MHPQSTIPGIVTISRNGPPLAGLCGILGILSLLLLCLGNNQLPLIDRDEPRFAEASREMLQNSDWVLPRFNNLPRYDKPPLVYWMQTACFRVLGETPFAARLPAALCTALTTVIISLWTASLAKNLANPLPPAVQAGAMFLLCLQNFVHGRAAVADPPMILCFTAAAWAGWEWIQKPSPPAGILFWTALGLGFLAKGPVAWIPLLMVGIAVQARRAQGLPIPDTRLWILGFCGMLLVVSAWGIPALVQTQGAFAAVGLGKHVVARSFVSMEGHGARNLAGYIASLPFYFLTVFLSFAPWAWWLPPAVRALWKNPSPEIRYLFSGVWITFGVFTLSRTKLPHYTLPAFPLLAILLSLWWQSARGRHLWKRTALCTLSVFILAPLAFAAVGRLSLSENLIREMRPILSPNTPVCLVDYEEPSLIWGLRSCIRGYPAKIPASKIESWLADHPGGVCIVLDSSAGEAPNTQVAARAQGWNFAKGKHLKLAALTLPRPAPPPSANGN